MAQHFLSYWVPTTEKREPLEPLDHSASDQYGRVNVGDTVWIVTVRSGGQFILIGRIVVDAITDDAGARKRLRTNTIWEAKFHIFAKPKKAEPRDQIDISDIAKALRFESKKDRLNPKGGQLIQQQLQTMRRLTIESAALLTQRWVGDDAKDNEDAQEEAIKGRTDIGPTTKVQLVLARRGQGIFRANVKLNEKCCRITGVDDPKHLKASHIKPWRDSSDQEKLNGCNGLFLAPHVDHLFDKGMISFSNAGELLVSSHLQAGLLKAWGIPGKMNVGVFKLGQTKFLAYHRKVVLKS